MSKFIAKTVDIVFVILLGVILLAMGVSMAEAVLSGWMSFAAGLVIVSAVFAFLIFGQSHIEKACKKIYEYFKNVPAWKLMLFLGLFSVVTKVFFVFLFNNNADLHPDMEMYRSFAEQYAKDGYIVENNTYATRHSYTAIYGLVLSPIARLFGADTKAFTSVLSVLHSASMVMLFDIFRKYVGKVVSFLVLMTYCILPFGLFQTQLLTHENGLFFLHILSLWIFLKAFDNKYHPVIQLLFIALGTSFLSVGKSINAAGRVFFVSFGIYTAAKLFEKGFSVKKLLKAMSVILVLVLFYTGVNSVSKMIINSTVEPSESIQDEAKEFPYGWPLYLGFNYEHSGRWNKTDRDTWDKFLEIEDKEEAFQYQEDLVKGRLQQYADAPYKLLIHLFNKIKVLWGTQTLPFAYEQGNKINDFVLRGAGGIFNKGFILLNGFSFLVLYSALFIGIIKDIRRKNNFSGINPSLHFKMAIIGVTLPLLLFEVMPKYVSHLHIMFFGVLAFSIKNTLYQKNHNVKPL